MFDSVNINQHQKFAGMQAAQDIQDNSSAKFKYIRYQIEAVYNKLYYFKDVRCMNVELRPFMN